MPVRAPRRLADRSVLNLQHRARACSADARRSRPGCSMPLRIWTAALQSCFSIDLAARSSASLCRSSGVSGGVHVGRGIVATRDAILTGFDHADGTGEADVEQGVSRRGTVPEFPREPKPGSIGVRHAEGLRTLHGAILCSRKTNEPGPPGHGGHRHCFFWPGLKVTGRPSRAPSPARRPLNGRVISILCATGSVRGQRAAARCRCSLLPSDRLSLDCGGIGVRRSA